MWRSVAGGLGITMILSSVFFVAAGVLSSPFDFDALSVLVLGGVILEFVAIAPEKVKISINAILDPPWSGPRRDALRNERACGTKNNDLHAWRRKEYPKRD